MRLKTALAAAVLAASATSAAAQTGTSAWILEAGPVDFSFAFGGWSSEEGGLGQLVPPARRGWFANPFFRSEAYRLDCSTRYVLVLVPPPAHEGRVCRILEAPVVGREFAERLQRDGYEITISYPFADARNGRALLFWSAKVGVEGTLPVGQGFARLEADGWRNQFEPAARCVGKGKDCVWRYFAYGDAFGAFINRFDGPDRAAATRIYQRVGVDAQGRPMTAASVVIDSWLLEPPGGVPAAVSAAQAVEEMGAGR